MNKLEELEFGLNPASLDYIKTHITTNDLNTQVIAGMAFVDGARYIIDKLKNNE